MSDKEWTGLMLHIIWLIYQLDKQCLPSGQTREWIKAKIRKDIIATKTPESELIKMLKALNIDLPDVRPAVNNITSLNLP